MKKNPSVFQEIQGIERKTRTFKEFQVLQVTYEPWTVLLSQLCTVVSTFQLKILSGFYFKCLAASDCLVLPMDSNVSARFSDVAKGNRHNLETFTSNSYIRFISDMFENVKNTNSLMVFSLTISGSANIANTYE